MSFEFKQLILVEYQWHQGRLTLDQCIERALITLWGVR
jgi:hypothetical protein